MKGVLYAVIGPKLYAVLANGTKVELGAVAGTNPVVMDCSDRQLCIVTNPLGYVYDNAANTFTQITDPDFPGSSSVSFLGGFFIHTIPDTGEFFTSNADEALVFDALDFATAEIDGDNLIRGFSDHGEFYAMGTETIEVWRVTGDSQFPLGRVSEVAIERGILARMAVARFDNTIVFVGNDKIVYRMEGYTPKRISHDGIDAVLEDATNLDDILATSYSQDGHTFLGIRSRTAGFSFWYDAATSEWTERATYNGLINAPWDIGHTVNAYGKSFGGSISTPNVYQLSMSIFADNEQPIVRESVSPVLNYGPNPFTTHMLNLAFVTGVGLTTGQGSDPQVILDFSDDGGRTFSNEIWEGLGAQGDYRKQVWFWQLGQSLFGRIYRVRVSDPVFASLMGAYSDIEIDDA